MIAVTGASGAVYAASFLRFAVERYETVYLTVTENAAGIVRQELGVGSVLDLISDDARRKVRVFEPNDLWAPPASGSHPYAGLVIVPCSAGTLGRIAVGISNDLVTRAADVCLKERRQLVLVLRETPLSLVHIRNMAAVAEAGAVVLPACPAFYSSPKSIEDLADFISARIAAQLGLAAERCFDWSGRDE